MADGMPGPGVPGPGRNSDERTVGELVVDISEQASGLIREEIELAKTEVSEKVNQILRGSVAGIAAGVFVLMALAMLMHGIAWLLNDLFFDDNVWLGFLVEALFWLIVGILVGLFAWRSLQAGAPPTPDKAIEEARLAKETFEAEVQGGEVEGPVEGPVEGTVGGTRP